MIVGLLWIKFIIVPKPSKEFPHFNEKNYLKSQGENKFSPWLFILLPQTRITETTDIL